MRCSRLRLQSRHASQRNRDDWLSPTPSRGVRFGTVDPIRSQMTVAAPNIPAESKRRPAWERLLALVVLILVMGAAANLLGWDIKGWFQELWDTLNEISIGYIIA